MVKETKNDLALNIMIQVVDYTITYLLIVQYFVSGENPSKS